MSIPSVPTIPRRPGSAPKAATNQGEKQSMAATINSRGDKSDQPKKSERRKAKKQPLDSIIPSTRCYKMTMDMVDILAEKLERDPAYIIRTRLTAVLEKELKELGLENELSLDA